MMPNKPGESSVSGQAGEIVPNADCRTDRTRQALAAAFDQLILETSYESMRVGHILKRADVGRSTFYQHFRSKDDLLRQRVRFLFEVLAATVAGGEAPPALATVIAHFRDNRRVARTLLTGPARAVLGRLLAEMIERKLPVREATIIPSSLIARHIAEAQLGLLEAWLSGGVACRPDAIAAGLQASGGAMARALCDSGAPDRERGAPV